MGDDKDNDKLIVYFMGQTNERLTQIEAKLVELMTFRAEVLASARATSVITGIIMSLLSVVVSFVIRKMGL